MRVHLTSIDVVALRREAKVSTELDDDGESFAEEAVVCFEERQLEQIESMSDLPAEDFMMEVFMKWQGSGGDMILETLAATLEEYDIELTFDEPDDEELDGSEAWEEDIELEDEDFEAY